MRTSRILMMGPGAKHVGGMSIAASLLADNARVGDGRGYVVRLSDSGGGAGPRGWWKFIFAALEVVAGRFELLHLHVASRGSTVRKALLGALCTFRRRPYVIHLHGGGYAEFLTKLPHPLQRAVRRFYDNAAGVIVLSESWARFLADALEVSRVKVSVVPNGVTGIPATPLSTPIQRKYVLFLGGVSRDKGVDVLLKAMHQLLTADSSIAVGWQLIIAGPIVDQPLAEKAVSLRRELGGVVTMLGPVRGDSKDALISNASLYCLPSRAEALPLSLLEALSAAVPSIATSVGSIPELLSEATGVLIVPPGDAASLADALGQLIRDPARRAAMGRAGRKVWAERFTAPRFFSQVADVWDAVLVPPGSPD